MNPPTEGFLRAGADTLWYADSGGTGTPVVFLHAYAGSGHSFTHQLGAFRDAGFRAVTYSRRGHLGSTGPVADAGPAADDLRALFDELGLGASHLVATAAGGFVAADFAQSWPGDVVTLTLACTMIGIEDDDYREFCVRHRPPDFDTLTDEERELSNRYRATDVAGVETWRRNVPPVRLPLPRNRRPITWATVTGWQMPVQLISGADDPYFPPPVMEAVSRRIADVRTSVIDGTGHSAYWERPDAFNRIVLDFVRTRG